MRVGYLECFAGIAGDMLLGALLDAGVPVEVLQGAVAGLGIGASLKVERVDRCGISSCKVHVLDGAGELADGTVKGHRHGEGFGGRSLGEIRGIIERAELAAEVRGFAVKVFELLGEAEARVHNVSVEEIHFHEVGAVDAIVDIVAASAGVHHLGVGAWYCSAVNVGGGTVECAHGRFPVPAPAAAALLRGVPTYSAHVQKELTTPTGAALLNALGPRFGPQPAMRVAAIGYGAGSRNPEGFANVLRVMVGDSDGDQLEMVMVLETALDDVSPQVLAYVAERAMKAGALDVMMTPVVMKKGRAGTLLTVLCRGVDGGALTEMLLSETTTLGVRVREERRVVLERELVSVSTEFGTIRVKVGSSAGNERNVAPEFEDCRVAAEQAGIALKTVQQAAIVAYGNRPKHSLSG